MWTAAADGLEAVETVVERVVGEVMGLLVAVG